MKDDLEKVTLEKTVEVIQPKPKPKPYFITLELDKLRELKYGLKSLKKLEDHFSCPVIKLLTLLQGKIDKEELSVDDIVVLIWAGLIRDDPELTTEKTLDIIDDSPYTLFDLFGLFQDAFAASTPEEKESLKKGTEEGKKKVKEIIPGTGKKSSKPA